MNEKLTYEELEQRIKELEKESVENKGAEEALRKSEERFRYLSESSPIGVFETDKNGSVLYLNNKWLEITGMLQKDALGFGWAEALHPEDRPRILVEWDKCLKEKIGYDGEFRFVRPSGEVRWVRTRTSPVISENGDVISHVGVNEDITEHKRAEEALQESEERLSAIVNRSPIPTAVGGSDGSITYFNEALEELIGYTSAEITDVTDWSNKLYPDKEYRDFVSKNIEQALRGEKQDCTEFVITCKDGTAKTIDFHTSFFKDGLIIQMVDITARVQAEEEKAKLESQLQQAQKMEAIGTLAGGIAHDFNNILSPIMVHSEMAMMDLAPDNPLQFNLKEIYKASERARDLVKQILTFARKKEEHKIPLKASLIVKEAIKFLRSTIPSTIDIHCDLKTEQDTVLTDPTQLNQIVMNLCTNAAHAMWEKGGVIDITLDDETIGSDEIKTFTGLNPGHYLRLSVRDTGYGIPPHIIGKIFEPYFTTKDPGEGTGMGLAIIHGIVKDYKGDIVVESEVGKGTTFHVLFPIIKVDVSPKIEPKIELPKGHERVLFVDDEKGAVDAGKLMLERLGYEVTVRTSSIEALELFRNKPEEFDLIITDQTMPNITGKELAKELMTIRPGIPVILCTGFSEQIDEKKAEEMGISAFVMKPIVMSEIANTIRNVLDKK